MVWLSSGYHSYQGGEQVSAYTHYSDCSTSDPCKRCFEFGRTTEQQRIIKLLEPYTICDDACDHYDCVTYGFERSIELIKGEK